MSACELCNLMAGEDASVVWRDDQLAVILVDDPAYPGFCRVVWHAHVKEMSDLLPSGRDAVMDAVWRVESALRQVMAPEKINLASLGNMVPHLHWHVIPRYRDDAHFPAPVWAGAERRTPQDVLDRRAALLPQLCAVLIAHMSAANVKDKETRK